jgi:speckle-type POZ protein
MHSDDMEPRVFRDMLHFIYTDTLSEIDNGEERIVTHQHLLVAADEYNMERLRFICEDVLCKYMGTDIAATTLVLAEQHGCLGLKEACFKFLRRPGNLRAVMATDGFQHLNNSCPSLLEEVLTKVAP